MRRMLQRLGLAALVATALARSAHAQNTLTLEGSVKGDAGPLGGAAVTAVNIATHDSAKTITRPSGEFRIIGLFTGQYQVTVRAIGYKPGSQTVQLVIGQHARLDFALERGATELAVATFGIPTGAYSARQGQGGLRIDW